MLMTILFAVFIGVFALGIIALVRAGLIIPAGIVGFLAFLALLLLFDMQSPRHEIAGLKSEIAQLKEQIRNMNTDNPAVLAGICLGGAAGIVALVFFGIYGLMYFQAVIRRAEADRGGRYLPQRVQAVHRLPERPEPAKALPEDGYRHEDVRGYAVTQYQGY